MYLVFLLLLALMQHERIVAMEDAIVEIKNNSSITASDSSDEVDWRQLQKKFKTTEQLKKKNKNLTCRLNTTRVIGYTCCVAMLALSLQCNTNSHSTVKGIYFNETHAINPPAPHPQGGFMIEDLGKFVLGAAGTGALAATDFIMGCIVPAFRKSKT